MFRELTFPGFVRLSRASRKASRRYTERGRMLQTGAVICAALGIDTDINLIYQVFALLLCILVVSRLSLAIHKPHVSVKRRLPRYATAHEPFEYFIEVTNEGGRVERDLTLIDNPTVIPPTVEQFQRQREPGEESRNAYDRWLGFHRFMWLQRLNTGITIKPATAAEIPVKARVRTALEATPLRRGVIHFDSINVLHPDPFALNYGIAHFAGAEELLVLPRRYPVPEHFELPGSRHFQPGGLNATWSIGESDEFVSLRDYRDGDSMRRIHWPSTAKRNKPVVKEYQDEYFARQALVLDNTGAVEEVLEEAISVAASFVTRMTDADSMLDLMYLTNKVEIITAGRGGTSATHQLEALVLTGWCDARRHLIEKLLGRAVPLTILLVGPNTMAANLPTFVRLLEPGKIAEGLARL